MRGVMATMSPSRLPLMIAALGAVLMLVGCQDDVGRPSCPEGQACLEYGNLTEPTSLDPHKTSQGSDVNIISDLMMGLTTNAPDGSPEPGMATHWETSPDGLTWTFHLRQGKWSDGTPVTADDFVFGLQRVLDPQTAATSAYLLFVLKNAQAVSEGKAPLSALGVRALDPHTLEITLEQPTAYLLELAKYVVFFPVPRHVVERYGDDWVQPENYVSNGAFQLADWRLGDRVTVTRNPRFWDADNVCLDRVNYYPTTDLISAERQVARGELDLNRGFQSNRYDRLRKTMPEFARTSLSLATAYMSLNTRDVVALKDVSVRRALSMAIDREFMTSRLLRTGQLPAYAFVPPPIANYVKDRPRLAWANMPLVERQARARALLAEAGYGPEQPLKITITASNNTSTQLLAEAIQADWRAVGVDLAIQQYEFGVALAAYRNRAFELGIIAWYADFNDPVTFLGLMKSDIGIQNYGDYSNPVYDATLEAASREPDSAERAQFLAQAEQLMLDDEATIPLYFVVGSALVSPRVSGWADNASGAHPARYLCFDASPRPSEAP